MQDNTKAVANAQQKLRQTFTKPLTKLQPNGKVKQFLGRTNQKGVILCDFSGSMSGEKHTKMTNALQTLIPKYPFFKIVAYGGDGEVGVVDVSTMTSLHPQGGTPMKKAFLEAYNLDPTAIILVTDGQPTDSSTDEITDLAVSKNIPVYSVGVKEQGGWCDYNENFLRDIAEKTGGAFMSADSPIEIGAAIGGAMAQIEYKGSGSGVVKL